MPKFSIVASEPLLSTRVFAVFREKAVQNGGFTIEREIVRHTGSAVMMARDAPGRLLLVRQFRLPARRRLWELPAGRLDHGEKPLAAAKRELIEETGYRARRWKRLVSFYPSPGYSSERMTVYLAEDLTAGPAQPEADESIESRWFTPEQIRSMIHTGSIADGKTLVGLMFLWHAENASKTDLSVPAPRKK
ncbi:MAG: NUDIX hydrolase [Acidobacteria bacterium]|nr:NUDIX hydrolase [Acidobacteriota bacterium]